MPDPTPRPLRPLDVAVALRLAQVPDATFEGLGRDLLVSTSTAHHAVKRLEAARLMVPGSRRVNRLALREFLDHGVRYAFPAAPGAQAQGVPTAHAAPPLRTRLAAVEPVVWPAARGPVWGAAVGPLLARAAELPEHCPELYEALTLVDALRIGRARERRWRRLRWRSVWGPAPPRSDASGAAPALDVPRWEDEPPLPSQPWSPGTGSLIFSRRRETA